MAKPKYFTHVEPKLELIEGWARDGLTDEQIAKNLGIAYSTFREYRNKYSALSTALKKGKEVVDYEVEKALLNKALKGDTTAMIFWLKNRRPDKWRDRKEHTEIDIANRELELKAKKLELDEKKALGETKDNNITIKVVRASEQNGT